MKYLILVCLWNFLLHANTCYSQDRKNIPNNIYVDGNITLLREGDTYMYVESGKLYPEHAKVYREALVGDKIIKKLYCFDGKLYVPDNRTLIPLEIYLSEDNIKSS